MIGAHSPHTPQPTNGTLSSFKKELYTLESGHRALRALIPIAFLFPLVRLSSILVQERKYTFSWETRNEWQIEIWVPTILAHLHHTHRFFVRHIFSLEQLLKRENYTPAHHYNPFLGTPEMSDKLRYESQIILRYYTHIIHELSLERYTTTSPRKTIPLERQTTPHLLSHWTTHLQYWWKDYVYSLSQ